MASNDKPLRQPHRLDFKAWAGVPYVVDPNVEPDHFYWDPFMRCYHIGEGTDLELRLFWLNLTVDDRRFLKSLHIEVDE